MSFWNRVSEEVKESLKALSVRALSWYKTAGKPFMKRLAVSTYGLVMSEYGDELLGLVVQILKDGVPTAERDEKFKWALKQLMDGNEDGKIKFDDLSQNTIHLIRSSVVEFLRTLGVTEEEQIEAAEAYLEGQSVG